MDINQLSDGALAERITQLEAELAAERKLTCLMTSSRPLMLELSDARDQLVVERKRANALTLERDAAEEALLVERERAEAVKKELAVWKRSSVSADKQLHKRTVQRDILRAALEGLVNQTQNIKMWNAGVAALKECQ